MDKPGELNLRVEFEPDRKPSLEALDLFVSALRPVLNEYTKEYTEDALEWDVSDLRFESIGLGIFPGRSEAPLLDEPLTRMSKRFVCDLERLEAGSDPREILPGSSYKLWSKWLKLLTQEEVVALQVSTHGASATLTPTGAGSFNMRREPERVVDTVQGIIQGVNFSQGTYFTLHRKIDNKAVRCHFPLTMEQAVVPLLRKNVSVTGVLQKSPTDETETLTVTIPPRQLRDKHEIPRIAELLGIAPDLKIDTVVEPRERASDIG